MTNPPSFLYFDFGNVLLQFDHEIACRQLSELVGIEPQRVRQFVFQGDLQHRYETGEIDTRQFHQIFCQHFQVDADLAAVELAASNIFTLNLAIMPVIVQLRAAGRRMGILSNTCPAHWEYCQRRFPTLTDYFEICVLSYEVGCTKPDVEIYRRAAELAGVPAESIFYTDDIPENVQGACKAGLDAVVFSSVAQLVDQLHRRGVEFNY